PPDQGGGSQVYFTRVNGSGISSPATVVKSLLTPANQALEFLTSQRPSGDSLLIYTELLETPIQHRSVRIAPDGAVRDNTGGTAVFLEDRTLGGFGRPIGAVFANNEWEILSSYDQTTDSSIFLHHLSTAGAITPPSGVFAEVGVGATGLTLAGQ